jgi:hypothetical protein
MEKPKSFADAVKNNKIWKKKGINISLCLLIFINREDKHFNVFMVLFVQIYRFIRIIITLQ